MASQNAASTISASGVMAVPPSRRRRVIVFADLAESVRLMQFDEAAVIERWRRFAACARDELIPAWGGRLVRLAGDGLLIECERPDQAATLARALHAALADEPPGGAAGPPMRLRIGMHLTEAVFDEYEAYGAGVNLASRLAGIAELGGTVASVEVCDGLVDGVHARVQDLGPRYLKHIDVPVRAFALDSGTGPMAAASPAPEHDLRPMVAVVPFLAFPPDPEHDALGLAIADEVIGTLARHPGLRVLSRLSTARVRDLADDLPRIRDLLGAHFLVSGRFYVRGARARVAVELVDLADGRVMWAATEHADIDALFAGQDDLVPKLVTQVAQQVMAHELVRVRSLPLDSLASYSLLLGATGLLDSLAPADFARARDVLEHLSDRHPRQALLHALRAEWHLRRLIQGWAADVRDEVVHARAHAQRALDLDPDQPDALVAEAAAGIVQQGDTGVAETLCLRAIRASPQHAMAWAQRSEVQRLQGAPAAGLASAEHALLLSPLDPQRYVIESFASSAALEAGDYGAAQRHARSSLRRHGLHLPPHHVLICALWLDGQHEAARAAAAECLRLFPAQRVGRRVVGKADARPLLSDYTRALLAAGLPA